MKHLFALIASSLLTLTAFAVEKPPLPTVHTTRDIEGWTVRVDDRLLKGEGAAIGERALKLLTARLVAITIVVPEKSLAKLRAIGIELDLDYVATASRATGPNVVMNCVFHGNGHIQPHMRWATGLLVDNCQVPKGSIDFMNRGIMGSGHGWAMGWAVAWNCTASSFLIQQPPGATNWSIGCRGTRQTSAMPDADGNGKGSPLPEGLFDSHNKPVAPKSLYLAQLAERLGAAALKNIGY